ncbi:MAG: discoidin domain-containing protein [Bacteroidales bacterium]|jgi:hypothetical protein|nr:discoidin domain-containing protein [Bacteroidales bacterium]
MKKVIILLSIAVFGMASCKDQYDISEKYEVPGGITYPGKAGGVIVRSGYERVEVQWPAGTDPSVVAARISWNNNMGDTLIAIPPGTDTIRCRIPLAAGLYAFEIRTYNEKGDISVPVEITGRSYGTVYINRFVNPRAIDVVKTAGNNILSIVWLPTDPASGAQYTEITYTSSLSGQEKKVKTLASETTTDITDFAYEKGGFKHSTVYLPDSLSIDPLSSEERTVDEYMRLDKKNASLTGYSSQVNSDPPNIAANAIDGSYTNRWHSDNQPYPHWITVNLGVGITVSRFGVWPSTVDRPAGQVDPRFPTRVKFEVSMNGVSWTSLGEYDCVAGTTPGERIFDVTPTQARHVRFTGVSTTNTIEGANYMVIAELDVYCR